MPTYGYECKSCGYSFEVFQSMSDAPLASCPQCGKAIRRIINGGSGIIFKGSGFYVTDKKSGGSGGKTPAKTDKIEKTESSSAAAPACSGCAKVESGTCPAKQAAGS
jgi:putative FmdB family regulatory protein